MSWPCPDCGEPFVPNHMCEKLREHLTQLPLNTGNNPSWRWLARTLMLEAHAMQQAFLVEQDLRANNNG